MSRQQMDEKRIKDYELVAGILLALCFILSRI